MAKREANTVSTLAPEGRSEALNADDLKCEEKKTAGSLGNGRKISRIMINQRAGEWDRVDSGGHELTPQTETNTFQLAHHQERRARCRRRVCILNCSRTRNKNGFQTRIVVI